MNNLLFQKSKNHSYYVPKPITFKILGWTLLSIICLALLLTYPIVAIFYMTPLVLDIVILYLYSKITGYDMDGIELAFLPVFNVIVFGAALFMLVPDIVSKIIKDNY